MKKIILIVFCFLACNCSVMYGQSLTEIIKSHEKNLGKLRIYRGLDTESWKTTGDVSEYSLREILKSYNKNVAILIYAHHNDTLSVTLISEKGVVGQHNNNKITKEEIIDKIYDVNTLFSTHLSESIATIRGANPIDKNNKDSKLENSYVDLNEMLLPSVFNLENYSHIIFVPIYNIATLPFSAFKLGNDYLIDKMSFSIAPSLFELMVSKEINSNQLGGDIYSSRYNIVAYNWDNALFVANPEYPKNSIYDFQDLPGAIKEVESITETLSPNTFKILTGNKATKSEIMKNICDYDLLYFATHGISNSENPLEESYLVLAEEENNTTKNNAFLTVKEIMDIRYDCQLNAALVILSACQTGLGKSHEGGIIGMARSFQIAGASHILMSSWNISDIETSKLMVLFFNELKVANSLQPHESLRNAVLKYKNEINSDPKYWAAFSIFGAPY